MADVWQLWDAELGYSQTGEPVWGVHETKPDGLNWMHIFPHNTLEWRVAEYGFDPEDVTTIVDVVIHEPFLPNPADPLAKLSDVDRDFLAETAHLPDCWTPGVPDLDRQQAHLERIALAKALRAEKVPAEYDVRVGVTAFVKAVREEAGQATPERWSGPVPEHPLQPIRTSRLDTHRLTSRAAFVEWQRLEIDRGARRRPSGVASWLANLGPMVFGVGTDLPEQPQAGPVTEEPASVERGRQALAAARERRTGK